MTAAADLDATTRADPTWRGRDGNGPLVGDAVVVDVRELGAYHRLAFAAPAVARRTRPGQFVELAVGAPHTLLRRPVSVHDVDGGTVSVVLDPHGPGTDWLAALTPGASVGVVGPLGRPFRVPAGIDTAVLVGGGYGTAPLVLLARALSAADVPIHWIVGAATAARLAVPDRARQDASVTVTTDDGSVGERGVVTDVLAAVAARAGRPGVFACGPMAMLRAVALTAGAGGLALQVAVEEHMACGVGVCWTCVVPVRDPGAPDHGRGAGVRMRRSCVDGPVFDGAAIAWEASRWAPATAGRAVPGGPS